MSGYPPLNTQVIGQAESALGALLEPLLAEVGLTFQQWHVVRAFRRERVPGRSGGCSAG